MADENAPEPASQRGSRLEIRQRTDPGGVLRLTLLGELDMASVPRLETCLRQLRHESERVRLDLAELEFMDSSGLRAVLRGVTDARQDGWALSVHRTVSPSVERVLRLAGVERYLWPEDESPDEP